MRQFYNTFEKSHAARGELSWTHYRLLLKVEEENARDFYLKEAVENNWSTRTLNRQIGNLTYSIKNTIEPLFVSFEKKKTTKTLDKLCQTGVLIR